MSIRSKSYDVLPALSVRRGELRRFMRIATISGLYFAAFNVLTTGAQLKSFARMIGFEDWHLGLLAAVPPITTIGQIFAANLIEQTGLRKYQFLVSGTLSRGLWLLVALIPLVMTVPSLPAVYAMLTIYAASCFIFSFAYPAWLTWMGDLVPKRIRGRYFAARMGFGRTVQVVIVVASGILFDRVTVPGAPETAAAQGTLLLVICGVFALGAVLGCMDILVYRHVREIVPPAPDPAAPAPVGLLAPLKDRAFRRFVGYGITISFAMGVPGWFFWVYTTESLGFSKLAANILYLVISPILGMLGLRAWGRLLDRWGRRPVLILGTCMTVFSVMPYFFSTPHTPWPQFITDVANWLAGAIGPLLGRQNWVWITPDMPVGAYMVVSISVLIGGIGWTGVMIGMNNVLMGFADTGGRSRFVASAQVLSSIGSALGAPVGGLVVTLIYSLPVSVWHVGPFIWTPYHATFAISCLARLISVLWLINMPDPGAGSVRGMMRQISLTAYNQLGHLVFFPLRLISQTRRSKRKP